MCKYDIAWVGKCTKKNVEGEDYCAEHLNEKCSICGGQATHNCSETMQLVCGAPLCDSLECRLKHYYKTHGYDFFEIEVLEEKLNRKPFKLVVSKICYGDGPIGKWRNEHYKDRLEMILLTYDGNNNIKFYKSNYRYYAKAKEEISELVSSSLYEEQMKAKGVYFHEGTLNIEEVYTEDILNKLEKVSLD